MASKILTDVAIKLYQSLGGNLGKVLGTRTNINFLGKGKSPELMVDMDINTDALGVLSQSKAVEELESAMGYLTSGKLNDMQANKLISNMQKMKDFYMPPAAPANITDLATGTRGLNKEGLESLRAMADDLPPPGSRGGADDIAAPVQSADEVFRNMAKAQGVKVEDTILPTSKGLEAIKNVQNNNLIIDDLVDKIYLNAGVSKNAQPTARANARDFLNRIKDLEDPQFPGGPTLSSVMEPDDFRFMTEGGGGGMGDPLLLVQKYFGPKVATAIAKLENPKDIQKFAERLIRVKDGRGRSVTDRMFDPKTVNPEDFEFADGGRVPYMAGMLVRGGKMGYQALRKYGIEAKDISRLFASLGSDKTLVGKEKTAYFQQLHKVLRNPDDFPDFIQDIQKRLGIGPIGFKSGGLAKILEV